ncbi:OmpA family protein [Magnetospirillum sp. J10]|uniref:OmpA family protein n=1 Tax=Magnetospirillum sulfuroxidans TaxID=611300 RepID=A0ABS5IGC2_9PROT|nr:OmpA family protein [Magnetospirillum sulfuroxidans]
MAPVASAQVIIGGSGEADVVVNWSVLDNLGRQPSLADMIKGELPNHSPAPLHSPVNRSAATASAPQGIVYKPYKPATKTVAKAPAKPVKTVAAPKPAKVAQVPPVAAPAPKAEVKPVATIKPALPTKPQIAEMAPVAAAPNPAAIPTPVIAAKGPQVSLPEVKAEAPKPVEPAKPVEIAKPAEIAAPMEAPKPVAPPMVAAAPRPLLAPVPPAVPVMPPQVASLPSSDVPSLSGGSDTISLIFAPDEAKVGDSVRSDLAALVKRLQKDEDLNLQLLAYAAGDEASASKARRLSLSRALEVRKFLMDKGVRSTRIEVRALGNKQDGRGPADRVDAVLVGR